MLFKTAAVCRNEGMCVCVCVCLFGPFLQHSTPYRARPYSEHIFFRNKWYPGRVQGVLQLALESAQLPLTASRKSGFAWAHVSVSGVAITSHAKTSRAHLCCVAARLRSQRPGPTPRLPAFRSLLRWPANRRGLAVCLARGDGTCKTSALYLSPSWAQLTSKMRCETR